MDDAPRPGIPPGGVCQVLASQCAEVGYAGLIDLDRVTRNAVVGNPAMPKGGALRHIAYSVNSFHRLISPARVRCPQAGVPGREWSYPSLCLDSLRVRLGASFPGRVPPCL